MAPFSGSKPPFPMLLYRVLTTAILVVLTFAAPASAGRPIVDLHKLDAYFALFASDSNVPWKTATVRLDTYSAAAVDFSVYQVDPGDVLTAGSNARPRAIDTRKRRPLAHFTYSPPGGYQFQSNVVPVPLGFREGFFVVEARRGNTGEQVWINRTRIGLLTKETPQELMVYGVDLLSGRPLSKMRIGFLAGLRFVDRSTDDNGIVRWRGEPRPIFALAQWGASFAFTSLLPQVPLPATIVGVRADTAVVHAGGIVRVVGFARSRRGATLNAARGTASITLRLGGAAVAQASAPLDAAGAFEARLAVPAGAAAGDYAVLAAVNGGVGGATIHIDATAGGITLSAAAACEATCDQRAAVPVAIVSSRGGVPVHVVVVRSPHVFIGYTPEAAPWGTSTWLDITVRTDDSGRATVLIPAPTDGLASTYGVEATSGGATAATRIIVPLGRVTLRLSLARQEQTLGTPVNFDVYATDVGTGAPAGNLDVAVKSIHGASASEQTLRLDASGRAHGSFSSPDLGTSLIQAAVTVDGSRIADAAQIDVVPQAARQDVDSGSTDARVVLDRAVYRDGDEARVSASMPGARGDALLTLESALGAEASVLSCASGHSETRFRLRDQPGALAVGAAFVRDGAIEWTSAPLQLDAPGRPQDVSLVLDHPEFSPGSQASVVLSDTSGGPGTAVVRVSRGMPSGSAVFDSAPSLLAVGIAATQVSAPAGQTWHPWVDSAGTRAQAIGFERRGAAPKDLTLAQAETQTLSWNVARDGYAPLVVQLPDLAGRYTLSVLKMFDDGRVVAASSPVVVR